MPNIYTKYVDKDECHALNCAPAKGLKHYKGEVIRCTHSKIYFCFEYVNPLDQKPWNSWKPLNPWLHPFKYDKADKLLKRGIR